MIQGAIQIGGGVQNIGRDNQIKTMRRESLFCRVLLNIQQRIVDEGISRKAFLSTPQKEVRYIGEGVAYAVWWQSGKHSSRRAACTRTYFQNAQPSTMIVRGSGSSAGNDLVEITRQRPIVIQKITRRVISVREQGFQRAFL